MKRLFLFSTIIITLSATQIHAMEGTTTTTPPGNPGAVFEAFEAQQEELDKSPLHKKHARQQSTSPSEDEDSSSTSSSEETSRRKKPRKHHHHKEYARFMKEMAKFIRIQKEAEKRRLRQEEQEMARKAEEDEQARQAEEIRRAAEEEQHKEQLEQQREAQRSFQQSPAGRIRAGKRNWAHQDLRNADLHGLELENIDFTGANLDGANLAGTRCHNVNFTRAHMTGVHIDRALFNRNTNFRHATLVPTSAYGAIFDHCNLEYVQSRRANFDCHAVTPGDIQNAHAIQDSVLFDYCNLNHANFENAHCRGLRLRNSTFNGTNGRFVHNNEEFTPEDARLDGANLEYAIIENTTFNHAIFWSTNLSHAQLQNIHFTSTHIYGQANMTGLFLIGCNFFQSMLNNVNCSYAHLNSVIFTNCRIVHTDMTYLDANIFQMNHTVLSNINFSHANLRRFSFFNAVNNNLGTNLNFNHASLIIGSFIGNIITYTQQFTPFIFSLLDRGHFWSQLNIDCSLRSSQFQACQLLQVTFSNIYFRNCQGLEQIGAGQDSEFGNVQFIQAEHAPLAEAVEHELKARGAKVNGKIDNSYTRQQNLEALVLAAAANALTGFATGGPGGAAAGAAGAVIRHMAQIQ